MGEVLVVRVLEHKGLKGYTKSAVLRKHSDHGSRLTIHELICLCQRILQHWFFYFGEIDQRPTLFSPFIWNGVNDWKIKCTENRLINQWKPDARPIFFFIQCSKYFFVDAKGSFFKMRKFDHIRTIDLQLSIVNRQSSIVNGEWWNGG